MLLRGLLVLLVLHTRHVGGGDRGAGVLQLGELGEQLVRVLLLHGDRRCGGRGGALRIGEGGCRGSGALLQLVCAASAWAVRALAAFSSATAAL